MIEKSNIRAILKQFNTSITFKSNGIKVMVYHVIDIYHLKVPYSLVTKTTLKCITELLNDASTTEIKIDSIEGYGEYNPKKLVL